MRRVPTPVGHGQPTTALPHDYARSINDAPAPQVSPLKKRTQHEPQRPATTMTAPTPTPTPSASVQPRPIAPAPATDSATATPSTAPPTPPKVRKRDEHRRVTHNEVERRRRDKINHWIEKLGSIIPVDGKPGDLPLPGTGPMMFGTPFTVDAGHPEYSPSKGGILSKACDYVMALHKQVNTLSECLKQSEQVNAESQKLRDSNARLAIENELLRERLAKMGISPPCIVLSPNAPAASANGGPERQ